MNYFICDCGRRQPGDGLGGCSEKEAEALGWRMIGGKWVCPFCCNDTGRLRKVFEKCRCEREFENYGK